jgi:3-methylfumaryl-CoA hydratase
MTEWIDRASRDGLPELAGWQPVPVAVTAPLDFRTVEMIAALLDRPAPKPGDDLPVPWHWAFLIDPVPQGAIGPDGHEKRGRFLPPVAMPRRMWAGSKISALRPLIVGETYARHSAVTRVELKEGRSGKLAFAHVLHRIMSREGATTLEERQTIVYRAPGRESPKPAAGDTAQWQWRKPAIVDSVMMFRYSAVTFNGHRIHYDHPYVTGEEGYPGLVVHGPLLATLMAELACEREPGRRVSEFSFSGKHPVFDGRPFEIVGNPAPDGSAAALAILSDGVVAMTGSILFAAGQQP